MKNERSTADYLKWILMALILLTTSVIVTLLEKMQAMVLPFFLAIFLSYMFSPIVTFLKKRRVPGVIALLVVFIFIVALFFGVGTLVTQSMQNFVETLPKYQEKISVMAVDIGKYADGYIDDLGLKPEKYGLSDFIDISAITGVIASSAGSFITFLSNFFLVLLFMFFILAGSGELLNKVKYAFSAEQSARIASIMSNIDSGVRRFLMTKTVVNLVTGVSTWLICLILGLDFAALWGFLAFLLNYIPNIGSIIAVFFPLLISIVQFASLGHTALTLLLLGGVQMGIGNVIEPKIMQRSMNLSPLLILVSLFFWGWLWGIWGMILSTSIMTSIKIIFENIDGLKPIAILMSGSTKKNK